MFRPGTLIEGTHRVADLVPVFAAELAHVTGGTLPTMHEPEDTDMVGWFIEKLDALAPEGYYFGAHPDDGADFGYWRTEPEPVGFIDPVREGSLMLYTGPVEVTGESMRDGQRTAHVTQLLVYLDEYVPYEPANYCYADCWSVCAGPNQPACVWLTIDNDDLHRRGVMVSV